MKELKINDIVFFRVVEQYWDRPYPKPRSRSYQTRSVIVRGRVLDSRDNQFQALLVDNNNFEKDGQEFWFYKNDLLVEQDFKDFERLGKWKYGSKNSDIFW